MGLDAQQMLQNDPQYLARQLARKEIQQYQNFQNPQLGLAATSGALLGRGIANLFGGRGFFDVSDPALRKVSEVQSLYNEAMQSFDPNDPASSYATLATTLAQRGYGREAALAAAEANKYLGQTEDRALRREEVQARIAATQETAAQRAEAAEERRKKITQVGTTVKGLATYRKGTNDEVYVTDDEGNEVRYDPRRHGRYETRQDAISEKGVQIRDIPGPGGLGVVGREIYDGRGNLIRREYLPGFGPNAAPTTPTSPTSAAPAKPSGNRPSLSSFMAP